MYKHKLFCTLINKNGIIQQEMRKIKNVKQNLSVGFIIISPNFYYKPHYHPANELYIILNKNDSEWFNNYNLNKIKNKKNWKKLNNIGDNVYHPSNIYHSMKTNKTFLLAVYFWWGQIQIPAKMAQQSRM